MSQRVVKETDSWDEQCFKSEEGIQLALHIKRKEDVKNVIEKIKKYTISTKIKFENHKFIMIEKELHIFKIPDHIFDLKTAVEWMTTFHNPKPNVSLATVGANDNIVVLNSSHSCVDGGFLLNLFNTIRDDIDYPETLEYTNVYETFHEKIEHSEPCGEKNLLDSGLTRISSKDDEFLSPYSYGFRNMTKSQAIDLKCYDKILKRPHGLTDCLYANFILSALAYKGFF